MHLPGKSAPPSTQFAFKLFRQLASEQENRNLFLSPASVMLCLWMLHEGATGETRESMAKVLEVADLDSEALQLVFVALKSALQPFGPGLQLEAANSLWCSHEWTPRSEYVAKIREHYDAEVVVLDFRGAETAARINTWVAAKTRGGRHLGRAKVVNAMLDAVTRRVAEAVANTIAIRDVMQAVAGASTVDGG